jgi:hypothetical protein
VLSYCQPQSSTAIKPLLVCQFSDYFLPVLGNEPFFAFYFGSNFASLLAQLAPVGFKRLHLCSEFGYSFCEPCQFNQPVHFPVDCF